MNFEIYMEKQTDLSRNNQQNHSRKSISPLKDMSRSFAKTSELSNNKKNSLTPASRTEKGKKLTKKQLKEKESKQK